MADAKIYTDSTSEPTETSAQDDETGQDIVSHMDPAALAHAQTELDTLAPGPAEPLHFGGSGSVKTQLDEDPISETLPFRESLP